MEFPKAYSQDRTEFRTHEAERKLYAFLKDYFTKAFSTVVSSVRYYLFGRSTALIYSGSQTIQITSGISLIAHGVAQDAVVEFTNTGGSEDTPTATATGNIGGIRAVGYDGTNYAGGGSIRFYATQPWGTTAHGTYIQFRTTPTSTTTLTDAGHIAASGSWASGTGALATNATTGFLYIPTCAGVPTGVPESISGRIPLVADTSGGKVYAYLGGWTALN